MSERLSRRHNAQKSEIFKEYKNATKGVDDGYYTCVVNHDSDHDPAYSIARCKVVIVDLCAESDCNEKEICEPDYETGTVECTCNYVCPLSFNLICSNTCELFPHECAMDAKSCEDGREREIQREGLCPAIVKPKIRKIDMDFEAYLNDPIILSSGLVEDGTPMAHVEWVFYPADGIGIPEYLDANETYAFTLNQDTIGTYRITLMHCMDKENAIRNEYRVALVSEPTTPAVTAAPTPEVDTLTTTTAYTCTAYPGGVIDDFNARGHFYDLSCTHILAADLMPGGSFYNPWFIYGTFDNHDGKTALMSMTFYLGRDIFEVQRGWVILTDRGSKLSLEEGVAQAVGTSGCSVKFADLHIKVDCLHFDAYYDGIMSGHIKLKIVAEESLLQKGTGNIGLCFDNQFGSRPNWQVGRSRGRCQVDTEEPPCQTETPPDCFLSQPPVGGKEHTTCGVGAEGACSELHCNGNTPTSVLRCALAQANRVNCSLKLGLSISGGDEDCEDEPCVWKKEIVSRGCPQENLPFVCP